MKKKNKLIVIGVIIVLALVSLFTFSCRQVKAETLTIGEVIDKLPVTNAGAYFSLDSKHWEFVSTFKALGYKGFNLNIGYASPDTAIAMLGYDILKLQDIGIQLPILKDLIVDAGWAIGWREATEEQEFSHGPAITFAWKF